MRNERKYKIISLLTTLLAVLLLGNCVREYWRMENKAMAQEEEYVQKGAKTYAQYCMQCHGPQGEGVVGMPLNRTEFKVRYDAPAGKDVYNLITNTLKQGRKASDIPHWEKAPDGHWISYTTMPAWGKANGGPFDDDYIKALVLFIMKEDGSQWTLPGQYTPPPDIKVDEKTGKIPLPDSQNTDVNAAAQALLRNYQKSMCLTCHTIGSKGGKVGPDLTHVGSWGFDQAFLENWIKYANQPSDPKNPDKTPAVPHDVRMPVYWSANRATTQPTLKLDNKTVSQGPYFMPRFQGRLTDEEISILAKYLMGLK